jgi:7-cyano-7-deazaguanine synthase in queuosine biosynthesis
MKNMHAERHLIHVAERGTRVVKSAVRCEVERDLAFSTGSLASYFFSQWKEEAYDALLVAAAVEFADRMLRRPSHDWRRSISLLVPVHDVERWRKAKVSEPLKDALRYLTGDSWEVEFYSRRRAAQKPEQSSLELPAGVEAVIPFSNGLDSRAVGGLLERELGSRLVRIRLSSRLQDSEGLERRRVAFTNIPYKVTGRFVESSARSRGFKFAVISGIAAYLSGAKQIVVPESGQGALGPSLVPVGQTYEDYRSHPTFTRRMERFFNGLFGRDIFFSFPQLWQTKGETLRRFIEEGGDGQWAATRSCWQQSRQVGVGGKRRQCGVCAACMLRRMSVHAAGGHEPPEHYVWERLSAPSLEGGVAPDFSKARITKAMREYALAGALHLDHLAGLRRQSAQDSGLDVYSYQLGLSLGLERAVVRAKLDRLIDQHAKEWSAFVSSLGRKSFVRHWAQEVQS